ncbi:MAG: hypothetical protein IJS62_03820 [Bacteroidales bacterium]|nr:hypothetical protein [Bacteroidales bacterium]
MKSSYRLCFAAVAACIALASCSKSVAEQMKMAQKVNISCNPELLEVRGGQIPATLTVTYPKGYFNKSAVMTVTPVLVYAGGEEKAASLVYQGEKVKDNYKVAAWAGGTLVEKVSFPWKEGMEKCYLELRSVIRHGGRDFDIPAVKVAEGCVTTSLLARTQGEYKYKEDGYQDILHKSAEGQILYDVNSAAVKNSELKGESVTDFQAALERYGNDERATVKGTQIVAYASPEGGADYNAKLSDRRAESAGKAWESLSGEKGSDVDLRSIGQDWEGFQAAVAASDLEDRDLILRVLAMYSDPAVRESEIRNMSQVFTEMKTKVFPALRRARFIADIEYRNYSDEELADIAQNKLYLLDESALLRLATRTEDPGRKSLLYRIAAESFNSEAARYNNVLSSLDSGDLLMAAEKAKELKTADADALNAKGVIELRKGNLADAALLFKKSGTDEAQHNLGVIDLLNGDYKAAAAKCDGYNKALALLLDGEYQKADEALTGTDAQSNYLRAVIAARLGRDSVARKYLDAACEADPALKKRAETDVEFASIAN